MQTHFNVIDFEEEKERGNWGVNVFDTKSVNLGGKLIVSF